MTDLALFLHVLGAMTLFGCVLSGLVLALANIPGGAFTSLLSALPAWALTLGSAYWTEHREHLSSSNATWLAIGHGVLEPGLVVLLAALGVTWWWRRGGTPVGGRISAGVSGVYLVLLALAWLAMSGKWGA